MNFNRMSDFRQFVDGDSNVRRPIQRRSRQDGDDRWTHRRRVRIQKVRRRWTGRRRTVDEWIDVRTRDDDDLSAVVTVNNGQNIV